MEKKFIFDVSETEKEILEYLWENPAGVKFREIMDYFNEIKEKNWKKQTVNTFLMRLKEKGLIEGESEGTRITYRAAYSKEGYEMKKAESILENYYDGSVANFVMALTGGEKLDKEVGDELRKLLKE